MQKQPLRRLKPLLIVTFLLSIGLGGFVLGAASSDVILAVAKDRYQELQIFTKVLNLVQQYYVEEVDTQKLIYGGIKGMLQELDPHTNFLPPDVYKEFESETTGEFGGIGIELTVQNDILTVIAPIDDTPAFNAGIQSGDRIVEINGVSTKGFSLAEAAQHMRGKQGAKVHLKIFRDGFDKPREFVVERGVVKVKSVKFTDLGDGYGYARLTSFIENTAPELEKNIKQMLASKSQVKGLIIDLRRNPGGLLDQAVRVSDMFLNEGVIVSTIGRNKREKEVIHAKREGTFPDFPLIVLIDEYSASASEILAGALQDNKRALIMGQQSFGKGSVQSVVKLGDGSGLKLTVARYYTPSGRSIQAEGIKPDVLVENVDPEAYQKAVIRREVRREQDITGHLLGEKEQAAADKAKAAGKGDDSVNYWWTKTPADSKKAKLSTKEHLLTEDYQVQQAYNYLRAWKVMERFQKPEVAPVVSNGQAAAPEAPPAKGAAKKQ
jgi:carboxyl-terminal processing protease